MWADFHFLRPLWLLLPFAAAVAALLPVWSGQQQGAWRPWVDDALVPWVLVRPGTSGAGPWWTHRAALLVLALLGIACAGPSWERRPRAQVVSGHALVVALDLSRSMLAEDLRPSRLARARFKLDDLVGSRGAAQTGLVVYAADAFTVTPLTSDIGTLRLQLPVLDPSLMPVQGSRADLAYTRAVGLLRESGFPRGDILLVTDEVSAEVGERLVEACRDGQNPLWILAAATAGGAPVPGLSPRETAGREIVMSRLDLPALRSLAESCGGRAVPLRNDDEDILQLARAFEAHALREQARDAGLEAMEWVDAGPWLLLLLLPVLARQARGHVLVVPLLAMLSAHAPRAEAFEAWRLWKHPDEHAHELLMDGLAEQAMRDFGNRQWKAWAAAEAGRLEDAARLLDGLDDVESLYNRGTALARLGRFPEALQVLDAALAHDPAHADARFNRDLIARLLEEQQESREGATGDGDEADESTAESGRGRQEPSGSEAGDRQSKEAPGEPPASTPEDPADGASAPSASPEARDSGQAPRPGEPEDRGAQEGARATEQWLKRIPDDPGGLLRNKFLYQSQRRHTAAPPEQEPPW